MSAHRMGQAGHPGGAIRRGRMPAQRGHVGAVIWAGALALALSACAGQPPVPGWQMQAAGALERMQDDYLSGAGRAAQADFRLAREALASTGEPALVARAELTRCALQVASLEFSDCPGFESLRPDAPAPERVYADYLAGRALTSPEAALLPQQHRAVATAANPQAQAQALGAIADPVARLVAAGVLLRAHRASPQVLALAVDTASRQGWKRPLLAWLGLQARRAELAGDAQEAARLRRRMALVGSPPSRD